MAALTSLRDLVLAMTGAPNRWIEVDGMTLVQNSRPTESVGSTTNPTAAFVLQGAKQSIVGEQIYEYRAGEFLVVTVDLPMIGRVVDASEEKPFVGVGIPLRASLIAELLLEGPRRPPARTAPGLAVSTAEDHLLDAITRLLRLHRRPADYQVLAPGIIREVHWWLLTGSEQAVVRQLGVTDSGTTLVAAAVRWIQQHVDQPLRIDALAARVGVGVSTLNRHFRAVTQLSPLQYQKALRLQRARLALLAGAPDVTRIGHEVGYQSPSQFSREYRRMFGVPPSVDRAAAEFGG